MASRMICPIRRGYTTSRCRARFIYSNLKASELGIAEHHSESRRRRSNSSEVHVTKCRCPLQNEMNHFHIVGVQSLHINPTHCLLHYILAQLSHFLKGDCVLSLSVPTHSGIAAFLAGCFNISHATTTPSCGPPGYLYGKDKASPMTQKRSRDALAGFAASVTAALSVLPPPYVGRRHAFGCCADAPSETRLPRAGSGDRQLAGGCDSGAEHGGESSGSKMKQGAR